MLAVFFGNDQIKVRAEAHQYIDAMLKPDQIVVRIEADNYEGGQLVNFSTSSVLFGLMPIYLVDTLSAKTEAYTELLEQLEVLAESNCVFVVIEKDLNAGDKKQFAKQTDNLNEYKKVSTETKFNPFTLAEALARKDKRLLWVLLNEAERKNLPAEEIIGILWWQLKTLRLAMLTNSAEEAGVKDFPYKKAKQALRDFKEGEIENLSFKLLNLYHDGHAGKCDINLALEEWVLRM